MGRFAASLFHREMNDTPEHIRKKQVEIWLAKSVAERFQLGLEMIQEVNQQIEDRIRTQNPAFSEGEVRAEFIRQMYKDELPPEYLQDVIRWVLEKYRQQTVHP
jgi:hypothetical protein